MTVEIKPEAWPVAGASDQKIAIVVSEYNSNITFKLRDAAIATLRSKGIDDRSIYVVVVPGAWELPFGVQRLIGSRDVAGVIALGAVIKGETSHDVHINRAVSNALMQLSLDHSKPVAFGLLTVNTLEQAIHRSGGNMGNKGEECAQALLACLQIGAAIDQINIGSLS